MSDYVELVAASPAERHRSVVRTFRGLLETVTDWRAPTPVDGWEVRDIVAHLVAWFPSFLAAGGVVIPEGPSVVGDPIGAWVNQCTAVQGLLDDKELASSQFTHPYAGTHDLEGAIDRFYTADVFMHTWDLARAIGIEPPLDGGFCELLVDGMQHIDEVLRSSGQYGPQIQVPAGADPATRLAGFIGRDPHWQAPAR